MRLPLLIHSGTFVGFFGSSGVHHEPEEDFGSSLCGLKPDALGTAYCGVAGLFGPGVEAQPASHTAVATATAAATRVNQFPCAVLI
jgi:hypothetical protein